MKASTIMIISMIAILALFFIYGGFGYMFHNHIFPWLRKKGIMSGGTNTYRTQMYY